MHYEGVVSLMFKEECAVTEIAKKIVFKQTLYLNMPKRANIIQNLNPQECFKL